MGTADLRYAKAERHVHFALCTVQAAGIAEQHSDSEILRSVMNAVHCSAKQWIELHFSGLECSELHYSAVQYIVLHFSGLHYSAVH